MFGRLFLMVIVAAAGAAPIAMAETEISVYTGYQTAPHSDATVTDAAGNVLEFTAGWEGRSFESPPYYGFRATQWLTDRWGVALEFTHAKVYADDETLDETGLDIFEFTDGLNVLTFNAMRRFPIESRFTPYVGGGVGLSIPYVEFVDPATSQRTEEYQITGFAARLVAGASYDLTDRWSVFGEYNGTFTMNDADTEGGGSIETDIVTNAVNIGVGFSF